MAFAKATGTWVGLAIGKARQGKGMRITTKGHINAAHQQWQLNKINKNVFLTHFSFENYVVAYRTALGKKWLDIVELG